MLLALTKREHLRVSEHQSTVLCSARRCSSAAWKVLVCYRQEYHHSFPKVGKPGGPQ